MPKAAREKADISAVYSNYADMLFRIAYSITLSMDDAQDAVHEVFVAYLGKLPDFRDAEHEKAWFVRATINKCRDHLRRRKVRSYTPLQEVAEIPAESIESRDAFKEVLKLPEKYKIVILLHYFEGYGISEISSALSISSSAVKMRLARGREMLRFALEGDKADI